MFLSLSWFVVFDFQKLQNVAVSWAVCFIAHLEPPLLLLLPLFLKPQLHQKPHTLLHRPRKPRRCRSLGVVRMPCCCHWAAWPRSQLGWGRERWSSVSSVELWSPASRVSPPVMESLCGTGEGPLLTQSECFHSHLLHSSLHKLNLNTFTANSSLRKITCKLTFSFIIDSQKYL